MCAPRGKPDVTLGPSTGASEPSSQPASRRWQLTVPAVVALATSFTFVPARNNGLVTWDNARMFLRNLEFRGLGDAQLCWAWTTRLLGEYMPVTRMTCEDALGAVRESQGRVGSAVPRDRRAVTQWPTHGPFRVDLGQALARAGRLEEALTGLRTAVAPSSSNRTSGFPA